MNASSCFILEICFEGFMFSQFFEGFLIGNGAILTNVCVLPLYPGLIAFLAGNANNERTKSATKWLGLIVFLGVLTLMIAVGLIFYLLNQAVEGVLPVLLHIIYGIVNVLGIMMLLGWNPFARLSVSQAPVLSNPYASAYVYGLLLGPMTLPCFGPLLTVTALLAFTGGGTAVSSVLYFLGFALGFGWPLVLMPFLAAPFQRRFTKWMTQNYT